MNVHGVTGYLSNLGDVEDMAKNTLEILKDAATLNRFRQNAQERARSFDLDSVVKQYEAVYDSLLAIA